MKSHSLSLALLFSATVANGLRFSVKQVRTQTAEDHEARSVPPHALRDGSRKRAGAGHYFRPVLAASSDGDAGVDLNTAHDLIYIANLTLGGVDYPVQLDTGSSDLWIKGPSSPLPNTKQTAITYNLTYGIGWAFGHISYGPVEFAGINITSQAFLGVSNAVNPALSYGAEGIVGLGFTSLSTIDALVNHTGDSTGRSLLYNAFADNPNEPNYIAFSLQRSTQPNDDVEGSFSIGEVEPEYAAVLNADPVSTWPEANPSRWNLLVDAILVGTSTVSLSTNVTGAPSDKLVALLDSGTSYTYAPESVCNAIYGNTAGAKYDSSLGQWTVPCDAEIDMAIQINGKVYPIHPLDTSPASLSDPNACVGSWIPQAVAVGAGEFDMLIGDNVLRSVYAVYDFGDFDSSGKMGNPYFKLLSLVEPNEASAEFHAIRGGTPATNITYNAASSSGSSSGSTTVSVSDDLINTLTTVKMYFPILLVILALNALVLILLVAGGIIYFLRQRNSGISGLRARPTPGRLSTMPLTGPTSTNFELPTSPGPGSHRYEPVSMALTEDSFVPPSPAFARSGGGGGGGDKMRPLSVT